MTRLTSTAESLIAAPDAAPFFDGGFRFARAMNYQSDRLLNNQLNVLTPSTATVTRSHVQRVPCLELTGRDVSNPARVDFPTGPRNITCNMFMMLHVPTGSTSNFWITDEAENYGTVSNGSQGISLRFTGSSSLGPQFYHKGLRVPLLRLDSSVPYPVDGIFYIQLQISNVSGSSADDGTNAFAAVGRYPSTSMSTALLLDQGYNSVSATGPGAPNRVAAQFSPNRSIAGYGNSRNTRTISVQNYSTAPMQVLHTSIRYGADANANIAGF